MTQGADGWHRTIEVAYDLWTNGCSSKSIQGTPGGNEMEESVVKSLALKMLQVPLFLGAQLHYPEFDPVVVYIMAGKIIQGQAIIPGHASTEVMQAEKGDSLSLAVDEFGTRVQAAKAAEEALHH